MTLMKVLCVVGCGGGPCRRHLRWGVGSLPCQMFSRNFSLHETSTTGAAVDGLGPALLYAVSQGPDIGIASAWHRWPPLGVPEGCLASLARGVPSEFGPWRLGRRGRGDSSDCPEFSDFPDLPDFPDLSPWTLAGLLAWTLEAGAPGTPAGNLELDYL